MTAAPGSSTAAEKRTPWKTIFGVVLWGLGALAQASGSAPSSASGVIHIVQAIGAIIAAVGAVHAQAQAQLAATSSSVRAMGMTLSPIAPGLMFSGGFLFAASRLLQGHVPVLLCSGLVIAAVVAFVVGWRHWSHQVVQAVARVG